MSYQPTVKLLMDRDASEIASSAVDNAEPSSMSQHRNVQPPISLIITCEEQPTRLV